MGLEGGDGERVDMELTVRGRLLACGARLLDPCIGGRGGFGNCSKSNFFGSGLASWGSISFCA